MNFLLKLLIPACLALLLEGKKGKTSEVASSALSGRDNAGILLALKSCIVDTCVDEYKSAECKSCKQDVSKRCRSVCQTKPGDGLNSKFKQCKKRCHQASKDAEDPLQALKNVKAVPGPTLKTSTTKKQNPKKLARIAKMQQKKFERKAQKSAKRARKLNRLVQSRQKKRAKKQDLHQCVKNACFQFLSQECVTCKNQCQNITISKSDKKTCFENRDCFDTCFHDDHVTLQFHQCKANCKSSTMGKKGGLAKTSKSQITQVDTAKANQCFSQKCYSQFMTGECAACKTKCFSDNFPGEGELSYSESLAALRQVNVCKKEKGCSRKECPVVGGKKQKRGFNDCKRKCLEEWAQ